MCSVIRILNLIYNFLQPFLFKLSKLDSPALIPWHVPLQ